MTRKNVCICLGVHATNAGTLAAGDNSRHANPPETTQAHTQMPYHRYLTAYLLMMLECMHVLLCWIRAVQPDLALKRRCARARAGRSCGVPDTAGPRCLARCLLPKQLFSVALPASYHCFV